MIRVEVANTFLVNMGKEFVILLRSAEDNRTLPISIGQLEAQSIAIQLNQVPFPRPLTHDLFKSVLDNLSCKLIRAEITDISEDTFYAKLVFDNKGFPIETDSRPSDAIAMALRFGASIFVTEKVMDEAGIVIPEDSLSEDQIPKALEDDDVGTDVSTVSHSPLEALQKQLQNAIQEERYEEAARIRDEISKISHSN
jgi:bifunctional DNase/RNase